MVMDKHLSGFPDSMNGYRFDDKTVFPNFNFNHPPNLANDFPNFNFNHPPNLANDFKHKGEPLNLSCLDPIFRPSDHDPGNLLPSSNESSDLDSPDDFSDSVLKYLNQILMEENMEEKPSMFHDPMALQAAEKSFYEVLGQKYPSWPQICIDQTVESPDDNFLGRYSGYSPNSSTSTSNNFNPQLVGGSLEFNSTTLAYFSPSTMQSSPLSNGSVNSFSNNFNGSVDSYHGTNLIQNILSDNESMLQFKRGMEEASKFLPSGTPLVIDLDKYSLPLDSKEHDAGSVVKIEKDERENYLNVLTGRKHHHQDDTDIEEERCSKQSAIYVDEAELPEMFDRVLLFTDVTGKPIRCGCYCSDESPKEVCKIFQQNGERHKTSNGRTRAKRPSNNSETVDLRTLLISCAQSVASDDCRTANEQLKQIRQHASPTGDAYQRLAHIFCKGIEARLAGTGTLIYAALASKRISATEKLKAYQVYLSSNPFEKNSVFFANKMIMDLASKDTLHIVDFGILYGFQWPIFIQQLSMRDGGPCKLRITGIELPQPGFRPAERVEETGRRLANYCERFKVPFEYHTIATREWENIKIEDLNLKGNEVLAVNCLLRFENLLDETVVVNNPRDAVLKLIRKMKPDIFVQAVINGSYNAPFFVTRFREALFHYSALFDVFEATLPCEDQHRLNFEQEFSGREIMNVVACEGSERVVRPEIYKQWMVRIMRAGFRPLPLKQEVLKKIRARVIPRYHKDILFDQDGPWMLQGWKGRILYASCCWVPA